ncbi:sarcosine oxidase subunit gamma family protein [Mesorhizobium japonicum]|uniref:Mll6237 protein n=1 Tax=Mesorhizobium japonicum (strain LMG 29417 / CECT 9101 / MAFF 303099) TaxID=266835 RepID=Q989Y3_RHILO|nr:sarcosine oxidase subunit gamma [Mesorhizobium japonicum]BAB52561.1 mll6237 [Mesorhizobium japonicum MAFF 303099]
MSEFDLIHRPAISTEPLQGSDAFAMKALPEGAIVHVLAAPREQDLASFLVGLGKGHVHAVSPGQWFIVGDEPMTYSSMKALFEMLEPRATGVDQSGGRVRIRIDGRQSERILSTGTAIDLSAESFRVGQSATTLIGHIAAHITRIGSDSFELIVLRSFAESLWDDLTRVSAGFR